MADYDSGLPIRSEVDGTDERVHVKIVDGTTDPAVNQTRVDSDNNLHIEVHGNRADDATDVVLRLSELGATVIDGLYHADDNSDPANIALVAHTRNATPGDTQSTERLTSIEDSGGTVRALDVSLHDEDGEAYSQSNPLPVTLEESEGDEVHDYDKGVAIAKDATSTHDYSVGSGDTFSFQQLLTSASGKMKVEVQIGDGAASEVFSEVAVRFNSTASPEADVNWKVPIVVVRTANTTTVRVIRTNLDNQPQDLYSTIVGITRT